MVQRSGGTCPTACSSHTRSDHGGARGNIPHHTPPVENIPISVKPDHIDDSVPTEEEVEWAVRRLQGNRSGGTSRMRVKYLQEWLQEHWAAEASVEAEVTSEKEGRERRTE